MMTDTMTRYLASISDVIARRSLRNLLIPLFDGTSTQTLSSAGLVIKAGGSALVKTGGSSTYAMVNGVLVKISSATDMAALSGTVTNAKFNVYCFFVDSGGTLTSAMGTEGSTIGAVKFPQKPVQKAMVGFVIINPTGTGDFVGGTTALDDATVVPNAAYVNTVGDFDPYALIGRV